MSAMSFVLGFAALAGSVLFGRRTAPRPPSHEVAEHLRSVGQQLRALSEKPAERTLDDQTTQAIASAQALSAQAHGQAVAKPVGMPRGAAPPGRRDFSNLRKQ